MKLKITILITFSVILLAFSTHAQVVIDWPRSHIDEIINYVGWDGTTLTGRLDEKNKFQSFATNGHKDYLINYLTWDKTKWSAKLEGNDFIHWPNGDISKSHKDNIINYLTHDGTQWTAKIINNHFVHTKRTTGASHESDHLNYITWDNSNWNMQLDKPNFLHSKGGSEAIPKKTDNIKYLTWNGTRYTASINKDDTFKHTDENGKSHNDKTIIYLGQDGSIWAARLQNGKFVHAPGFIPEDRRWFTGVVKKVFNTLSKIDIHGGLPVVIPPGKSQQATVERKGIFLKNETGLVIYRPLDEMGNCTNNLSWFSSDKLISRKIIGHCDNLGHDRNIYSFILTK